MLFEQKFLISRIIYFHVKFSVYKFVGLLLFYSQTYIIMVNFFFFKLAMTKLYIYRRVFFIVYKCTRVIWEWIVIRYHHECHLKDDEYTAGILSVNDDHFSFSLVVDAIKLSSQMILYTHTYTSPSRRSYLKNQHNSKKKDYTVTVR